MSELLGGHLPDVRSPLVDDGLAGPEDTRIGSLDVGEPAVVDYDEILGEPRRRDGGAEDAGHQETGQHDKPV